MQIIFLGIQLWVRAFLPAFGIVIFIFISLAFLNIEIREFLFYLIPIVIFFPISSFLVDRFFKKITRKKFNIEINQFIGWSIIWRTSLMLGVIGGILSFIPHYNQLNWLIKGLLPNLFSIPILGWIANFFLNKQLPQKGKNMEEETNVQKIYDKQIYRLSLFSFVLSLIWLAGIGSLFAIILGRKALQLSKQYEIKVVGSWAAKFGYIVGWIGLGLLGLIFILIIINSIIFYS